MQSQPAVNAVGKALLKLMTNWRYGSGRLLPSEKRATEATVALAGQGFAGQNRIAQRDCSRHPSDALREKRSACGSLKGAVRL
jgi:hypothetical protein